MSSSETPVPLTAYQNVVAAKDSVVTALKRAQGDMAAFNGGNPECVALAKEASKKISRMLSLVENQFSPTFFKKPSWISRIILGNRWHKEAEVVAFYQGLMKLNSGLQTIATSAAKVEKKADTHIFHFRLFWLLFLFTVTFTLFFFPSKTLMLLLFCWSVLLWSAWGGPKLAKLEETKKDASRIRTTTSTAAQTAMSSLGQNMPKPQHPVKDETKLEPFYGCREDSIRCPS